MQLILFQLTIKLQTKNFSFLFCSGFGTSANKIWKICVPLFPVNGLTRVFITAWISVSKNKIWKRSWVFALVLEATDSLKHHISTIYTHKTKQFPLISSQLATIFHFRRLGSNTLVSTALMAFLIMIQYPLFSVSNCICSSIFMIVKQNEHSDQEFLVLQSTVNCILLSVWGGGGVGAG